jgi:hypothetical protein
MNRPHNNFGCAVHSGVAVPGGRRKVGFSKRGSATDLVVAHVRPAEFEKMGVLSDGKFARLATSRGFARGSEHSRATSLPSKRSCAILERNS